MAKWSPIDPGDTRDYRIDYAPFLPDGDTITDATVTVPDELELVAQTDNDTDIVIRLSVDNGVIGTTYDVYCVVTTTSGQIFPAKVKLKIAERIVK